MDIENKKDAPEELKKEENINYLKKFGEGNDQNDQKLMKEPQGGKMMKTALSENVNKQLAGVNDEKAKEAISAFESELKNIPDGPLSKENAQKLKNAYNTLNNLTAQEFDQDGRQTQDLQKSQESSKKEYTSKLDESVKKIKEMMQQNQQQAQENVKKSHEKAQQAHQEGEKQKQLAGAEAEGLLENLESPIQSV